MLYANNEDGERVRATPRSRATCPTCIASMIAKCGKTVVWHWAHESIEDCDPWSEGETTWHAAWKSRFSDSEVTIRRSVGGAEYSHRADVVTPSGVVVEFQHSAISAVEIEDRELFYGDMVWVLDATAAFSSSRIELNHQNPKSGTPFCKFRWLHRKRSFDESSAPVFLDLGVAFRDIGEPFHKPGDWWDDGGLKDGYRRSGGIWQRMEVAPMLLEIKKRTDGSGWGRVLTHAEFCRRFGAAAFSASDPKPALRKQPDFFAFDGFVSRKLACGLSRNGAWGHRDYEWCEEEIQKGVIG